MSYSGTWYQSGQGQTTATHQYGQPSQYHQQYDYNQQGHQSNHQQPPSSAQYQPTNGYENHNSYHQWNSNQGSNGYENHNQYSQWNNNQPHYDDRSSQHSRPHQQQPYPQQQQQYVPQHAAHAPPTTTQSFGNTGMHYQYSDLRGKRKALLIGCNYPGGSAPLGGCINDVHNMKNFLIQGYRFQPQNMWIMTDDLQDPRSVPTRQNIFTGMQWLVANAQPGDDLFFHFSGHGGPVKDEDGDEDDGNDEAIFPTDAERITNGPGFIVDDLMHDVMVKPLPQGCRLTAIFDCCHSGSILDLPYMYSTKGALKEPNLLKDAGLGFLDFAGSYKNQDLGGMIVGGTKLIKRFGKAASGHHKKVRAAKTAPADVICFSGCRDDQTSADASIGNMRQGAMSHSFQTALKEAGGNLTYIQLLNAMRQVVANGNYTQKPQLSACHPIDLDLLFTL